jgi:hypothetical protein
MWKRNGKIMLMEERLYGDIPLHRAGQTLLFESIRAKDDIAKEKGSLEIPGIISRMPCRKTNE